MGLTKADINIVRDVVIGAIEVLVLPRFETIDARLDTIEFRLDGIDDRLDGIDNRLDGIDDRLDGIDNRLDGIDDRLDGMDRRLDSMDKRLEAMNKRQDTSEVTISSLDYKLSSGFSEINRRLDVLEDYAAMHENDIRDLYRVLPAS